MEEAFDFTNSILTFTSTEITIIIILFGLHELLFLVVRITFLLRIRVSNASNILDVIIALVFAAAEDVFQSLCILLGLHPFLLEGFHFLLFFIQEVFKLLQVVHENSSTFKSSLLDDDLRFWEQTK